MNRSRITPELNLNWLMSPNYRIFNWIQDARGFHRAIGPKDAGGA
jgi:hypothetical protein